MRQRRAGEDSRRTWPIPAPDSREAQSDPQVAHSRNFTNNTPGIYILRFQQPEASRNSHIPGIFRSKPFRIYILPPTR